jgi:nitroreductase
MGQALRSSAAVLIVLYDPERRAPASEGDFLGIMSLGCVMQNLWLMAESLGIGLHVLSSLAAEPVAGEVKRLLSIPEPLRLAFACRLGYVVAAPESLRVRREVQRFAHHNCFGRHDL